MMGNVPVERLVEVMVEIADTLVDDFDLMAFLYTLTVRTAELMDASEVGLMISGADGDLQFVAASREVAETLELFQQQVHEGPCLDASRTGTAVTNVELSSSVDRWPAFAPRAMEAGFAVVHAFPMRLREQVIGALNVFTAADRVLSTHELTVVRGLADVATISLLQERALRRATLLTEQLQVALSSRVLIEQAKGAIAQVHQTDVEAAFQLLRSYARRHHHRLTDLAEGCLSHPEQYPELMAGPRVPPSYGAVGRADGSLV
jgi:GAF domain-containing protein